MTYIAAREDDTYQVKIPSIKNETDLMRFLESISSENEMVYCGKFGNVPHIPNIEEWIKEI